MYTNQSLAVNWNGYYSSPFPTSNEGKQGEILSPILFCVYKDELISRLKQSGVGCFIRDIYLGSLGYTDDLCLLAPTRGATQIMLGICEKFDKEYDVMFNSQKCHLILYNTNYQYIDMPQLHLNGETLQVQKYACHLGHPIGNENVNKIFVIILYVILCGEQIVLWLNLGLVQLIFVHLCSAHIVLVSMNVHYAVWVHLIQMYYTLLGENVWEKYGIMSRFLSFYDSTGKSNNEYTRFC